MQDGQQSRDKELILPPGTYAYMQDVTKGTIKTFVGPCVINQTAQEIPVAYDPRNGTFVRCRSLDQAVRQSPIAVEGYYLELLNPASNGSNPEIGSATSISPDLDVGRKINIPGPAMFPLWPGQAARYIRGHHLRSNQYLLVRVYNEEEAKANWAKAVIKPATEAGVDDAMQAVPTDLTVGKQIVIEGTEISFYIPPTGISVVSESKSEGDRPGNYVRDAVTLERLEYSILVDEDGNKRYEKGPQVVFPKPTEKFIRNKKGDAKFRAVELNEIQGIHIKVIAPYRELDGTDRKEGEELFITGKETSIYYPREEHSLIKYDGKGKHFATAIPAGEARYVMDRMTGTIRMEKGPAMLLPDPRKEVIVRRILTDRQCELWYPGNKEALQYNRELAQIQSSVATPTTRSGAVSEGEVERGVKGGQTTRRRLMASMDRSVLGDVESPDDGFVRSATHTQPRTLTLNTKYHGVPSVDIWTGYACMLVSKTGDRRVEVGPTTVPLDYDESIEVLEMSTGKPKTTDRLLRTVFLRTTNNKISDIFTVETSDHVKVEVYVSHKVNFEGDPDKWFLVENYVKYLCDHVRSVMKGSVKKIRVEDFYADYVDITRNIILGRPTEDDDRPGMLFSENGMRICDVEILRVSIKDERIQGLLDDSQHQVVRQNIELSSAKRNYEVEKELDALNRGAAEFKQETKLMLLNLQDQYSESSNQKDLKDLERASSVAARRDKNKMEVLLEMEKQADTERSIAMITTESKFLEENTRQSLRIQEMQEQTKACIEKARAVDPHLATALMKMADDKIIVALSQGFAEIGALQGLSVTEAAKKFLKDFVPDDRIRMIHHTGNGNRDS